MVQVSLLKLESHCRSSVEFIIISIISIIIISPLFTEIDLEKPFLSRLKRLHNFKERV